ncbi:MAG: hypothetical protein IIB83_09320, partial [Bacteroidetes bacterium]|nr:hypothetical protein [Bacteroidota bacterium]
EKFQIVFAEPYDEEFINMVIFDLYNYKIISKEDLKEFKERFEVREKQLKSKAEDLYLYCQSKGKIYKCEECS